MMRRSVWIVCFAALLASASGCVVNETKPLPKINPIQADREIPEDQLLDVAVHPFDTGIPPELAKDPKALEKKRINPDIRQAEGRYIPTVLRSTLESSGQWGAVRVVPENAEFVDVQVSGKILESTGAKLALEVTVKDSTGRVWINSKHYESPADTGSYKTDASLKARDPFQNIYSEIANDMVAARDALQVADLRDIRRVTQLEFANDLAPQAMGDYLTRDPKGFVRVTRLPAENDPIATRVQRIRERDSGVIDTVNGYYANFADKMSASYGQWRRASFDEIEKEQRTRNQARMRTFLGAAAVLASVFVPGQCNSMDYNCRRIESAARTAGAIGGTAAIISGLKKYSDAKVHAQALRELSDSFQTEVTPQVVDVEGRTLKLTGTAEEQYREWRKLLHQLYLEETGVATQVTDLPAGPDGAAPDGAVVTREAQAETPGAGATSSQPDGPPQAPTGSQPGAPQTTPVQSGGTQSGSAPSAPPAQPAVLEPPR